MADLEVVKNDNPDTNMDNVDTKILKLAALVDTTVRFHVMRWSAITLRHGSAKRKTHSW